jgi:DUF1365 family protein
MTMPVQSAIYRGSVMHRRLRPRAHYLRYAMFYLLLDLDELPALGARLRCFGHERRAVLSFRAADHGDGGTDLKGWVHNQLAAAGLHFDCGPIRLLTMPRVFGYVFNPISIFYCHDRAGTLRATIYEVNNTFGGRHAYVLPVTGDSQIARQACAKKLYVSPFNDVSGGYRFAMLPPAEKVALTIDQWDDDGPLLRAAFVGQRQPISDGALLKLLVAYPLLTLKVVAGIHWEALKLWLKGVPLHKRPSSTDNPPPGTIVRPAAARGVGWGSDHAQF